MKAYFNVDDFSLKGDKVALGMQEGDSSPIPLVSGDECIYHVEGFSWSGQWVLVTGFVGKVLRSCWLGQFEERDNSNPFLRRLIPIVSGEALVLQDSYLAFALYGLFHKRAEQHFTIHIGTADVLAELEHLFVRDRVSIDEDENVTRSVVLERLVKAVLSLRIARSDLEEHAPGVLVLIPEVLALYAESAVKRATELCDAQEALELAQVAYGVARRRQNDAIGDWEYLERVFRYWRDEFPEASPSAPPE